MGRARRRSLEAAAVALVTTALAAVGLQFGILAGYSRAAGDALFPSSVTDARVMVVGIDAEAVGATGTAWPWPRARQAELVRAIDRAGAAAIVVDIAYGLPGDGDEDLTEAIRSTDAVVAAPAEITAVDGRFPAAVMSEPALDADRGHVATFADPHDGVTRTLPLLVETPERELVPALSLAGVMRLEGAGDVPTVRPGGVQIGDRFVPTEASTVLRLNIAAGHGVGSDRYVSARELLGDAPPDLSGALVFVGVTDPTLGDRIELPTVKGDDAAGVIAHAQAANTILTASYLQRAGTADTLVVVALLALLMAGAVLALPLWAAGIGAVGLGAANTVLAFVRFDRGVISDLVYTNAAIVVAFGAALAIEYWTETRHRRRLAVLFGRYVPAEVVADLASDAAAPDPEVARRVDVTAFFCDLRGFTERTERSDAADVRAMLQIFYEAIVAAIDHHGGTVMQFVGDEVFAIFGAPVPRDDHRRRALAAAIEAHENHAAITAQLSRRGLDDVAYGIGLSSGEVVAGHVGGGDRLQYAMVGDAVNVGARLCSLAGGGEIICPDDVLRSLEPTPPAERVHDVVLKGVARDRVLWRLRPSER